MSIEYNIDGNLHMVIVRPRGVLSLADMVQYQREVWTRTDLAGYNELVDMNEVTSIAGGTTNDVVHLASLSIPMDAVIGPSRLAIIAAKDYHYGMGRMYKAYREDHPGSTKEVGVFRTREEAMRWLAHQ
jgi:hypothetical protein